MTPHVCLTLSKNLTFTLENNDRFVIISNRYNLQYDNIVVYYFTGFNHELDGLSIVVSEREGETDEEISFTYDYHQRNKKYDLDHFRYTQYVRLKTSASTTTGMVLDEVEVYAFSK